MFGDATAAIFTLSAVVGIPFGIQFDASDHADEEAPVHVYAFTTVIVPVAFTDPQPPVNGIL